MAIDQLPPRHLAVQAIQRRHVPGQDQLAHELGAEPPEASSPTAPSARSRTSSATCWGSPSTITRPSTWTASSGSSTSSVGSTSTTPGKSTTLATTGSTAHTGSGSAPANTTSTAKKALAYARSRQGIGDSDFSRARRQQQIIVALRDKLTRPESLTKIPDLLDAASSMIRTNFPVSKAADFVDIARNVDPDAVKRQVLGPPYSKHPPTSSTGGTYILKLDMERLRRSCRSSSSAPIAPTTRRRDRSGKVGRWPGTRPRRASRVGRHRRMRLQP